MRTREEIEEQFKDLIIPAGRDDLKVNTELLLDIRDLLDELVEMKTFERELEMMRVKRERSKIKREKEVDMEENVIK